LIPVEQTRTGSLIGNCFAACLASILEISISSVPDFDADGNAFLRQVNDFLLPLDLFYIQVSPDNPTFPEVFRYGNVWHTIEGISERGGQHACVGNAGELVFDPHPGGKGLVSVDVYGFLVARFSGGPSLPNSNVL